MADTRFCTGCSRWKPYTKWHHWQPKGSKPGFATFKFAKVCLDCQQQARFDAKAQDPAKHAITKRAKKKAEKYGVPLNFILYDKRGPRWALLIPYLRALLEEHEAVCLNCADPFDGIEDMTLDHIEAPRKDREPDWPREHARNIRIGICDSSNSTKGSMSFADWLDVQHERQLARADREDEALAADPYGATWCEGMLDLA